MAGSERIIFNLAANPKGGKSYHGRRLAEYGFHTLAASDVIRDFGNARGMDMSQRADLRAARKILGEELGPTAISQTILNLPYDRIAVAGIRVNAEIDEFRTEKDANGFSVALWCPLSIRFQRVLKDDDPKYPKVLSEFARVERPEYFSDAPNTPSTMGVMLKSEYDVNAALTEDETYAQIVDRIEQHIGHSL